MNFETQKNIIPLMILLNLIGYTLQLKYLSVHVTKLNLVGVTAGTLKPSTATLHQNFQMFTVIHFGIF
jgi:hypothetical protein